MNRQQFVIQRDKAGGDVEFVKRKLIYDKCVAIKDDDCYKIIRTVATKWDVHESDVVIIGSAKLGYSINPNNNFRNFFNQSDIDVGVISERLLLHVG